MVNLLRQKFDKIIAEIIAENKALVKAAENKCGSPNFSRSLAFDERVRTFVSKCSHVRIRPLRVQCGLRLHSNDK